MIRLPQTFKELLKGPPIDADLEDIVEWAGYLIDNGDHLILKNLEKANLLIDKAEALLNDPGTEIIPEKTKINKIEYFLGNLWSCRARIERIQTKSDHAWYSENVAKSIYHYRRSLLGKDLLEPERRSQVLANLANLIINSGRFIEAIEYWEESLSINPGNAIALGNLGQGLFRYGNAIHDSGHRLCIWIRAKEYLDRALSMDSKEMYPGAQEHFQSILGNIKKAIGDRQFNINGNYSMGRSKAEKKYRSWVLSNRLFLNTLNDLGTNTIAARDILSLPNVLVSINEEEVKPWRHGLFDQIKQEYVSARYLFYEGIQDTRVHYSDRQVRLINSLDYPCYGLATEKLKAAFRSMFSILDKIAYFLNFYLSLELPEYQVDFNRMWYSQKNKRIKKHERPDRELSAKIMSIENWPLRGL